MNLPSPPAEYSREDQTNLRAALAQAERSNLKKNIDIEMGKARIFLQSPSGARWILTAADDGTLSLVAA